MNIFFLILSYFSLIFYASGQQKLRFYGKGVEIQLTQRFSNGVFAGLGFDMSLTTNIALPPGIMIIDTFYNDFLSFYVNSSQEQFCIQSEGCALANFYQNYSYPYTIQSYSLNDLTGPTDNFTDSELVQYSMSFQYFLVKMVEVTSMSSQIAGILGTINYLYYNTNMYSSLHDPYNIVGFFIVSPLDQNLNNSQMLLGKVSTQYCAHNATTTYYSLVNNFTQININAMAIGNQQMQTQAEDNQIYFSYRDVGLYVPESMYDSIINTINDVACGDTSNCIYTLDNLPAINFELEPDVNSTKRTITIDSQLYFAPGYFNTTGNELLIFMLSDSVYYSVIQNGFILGIVPTSKYYLSIDYQENIFSIAESSAYYRIGYKNVIIISLVIVGLFVFLIVMSIGGYIYRKKYRKNKQL